MPIREIKPSVAEWTQEHYAGGTHSTITAASLTTAGGMKITGGGLTFPDASYQTSAATGAGKWGAVGGNIYRDSKVAINTTATPTYELDVTGTVDATNMRVAGTVSLSLAAAASGGAVRYNEFALEHFADGRHEEVPSPVRGVEWDQANDTWSHIDENANTVTWWEERDFDNHEIWGEITRVNVAAGGSVAYKYGDTSFAEDGTMGMVMVRIPAFYIKGEKSGDKFRWWISPDSRTGFELHPALRQRNHVTTGASYLYIGAYEADGWDDAGTFKLHSRSGATPVTGAVAYPNLTGGTFSITIAETAAGDIGTGWGITNIWTRQAVLMLIAIEYGNLDSQTNIGRGIVDKAAGADFAGENTAVFSINDNLQDNLTVQSTFTSGTYPIAWRGIENIWGNAWEFVVGYNALDAEYRIVKKAGLTAATMASALGAGEYDTSIAVPQTAGGYIDNLEWEDLLEYLFIPSSASGSSTTHIPDYIGGHDSAETNILLAGGGWSRVAQAGAACLASDVVVPYSSRSTGARVEYL